MNRGVFEIGVVRSYGNCIPFCFSTDKIYIFKIFAVIECFVSNACYAIRDCDACKTGATIECTSVNSCNAIGNCYACKTGALTECTVSNACYAIRDRDAC